MSYRINRQASCFVIMIFWVAALVAMDIYLIRNVPIDVTPDVRRLIPKLLGQELKFDQARAIYSKGGIVVDKLVYNFAGKQVLSAESALIEVDPLFGRTSSITVRDAKISIDDSILNEMKKQVKNEQSMSAEGEVPFLQLLQSELEFSHAQFLAPGKKLHWVIDSITVVQRPQNPLKISGKMREDLLGEWVFEVIAASDRTSIMASCEGMPVDDRIRELVGEQIQREFDRIKPNGTATVRLNVMIKPDQKDPDIKLTVFPHKMSVTYKEFAYKVDNVEGELEFNPKGFFIKYATGDVTGGKIFLSGTCDDYAKEGWFKFDVRIDGIDIDNRLLDAASPTLRKTIEQIGGSGRVAVHGYIRKKYGRQAELEAPIVVKLLNCRAKLKAFPYVLTDMEGLLELREPAIVAQTLTTPVLNLSIPRQDIPRTVVMVNRVTGRSGDARFEINGYAEIAKDGLALNVTAKGKNVPFDSKLYGAIQGRAQSIYKEFQPYGTFDVEWNVRKEMGEEEKHTFSATLTGAEIRYQQLPLKVQDLQGEIHGQVCGDHMVVQWHGMRGRYETSRIESSGEVHENGVGSTMDMELRAVGLPFTTALFEKLPKEVSELLIGSNLKGNGNLRARLRSEKTFSVSAFIPDPRIRAQMSNGVWSKIMGHSTLAKERSSFDAELKLSRASLDFKVPLTELDGFVRVTGQSDEKGHYGILGTVDFDDARIWGKRFTRLSGSIAYGQNRFNISKIVGMVYDGVLTGRLTYDLNTKVYEGGVRLSSMELREFKQDIQGFNQKSISGRMSIDIPEFRGLAGNTASITGKGTLEIWDANLWDVPVFLRIFTLDPTKWGGKSNFNAGIITFEAKNDKIELGSIVFKSEDAYLYGSGFIDFNWKLDVVLKVETKILGDFWLFRPVDFIFNALQGAFLGVEVKGPFDDPDVNPKMFPARPLKK